MALVISKPARAALKELLQMTRRKPNQVIRLVSDSQGDGLVLGKKSDGDQVIRHDGLTILVVDPILSEKLSDRTLDVRPSTHSYSWNLIK